MALAKFQFHQRPTGESLMIETSTIKNGFSCHRPKDLDEKRREHKRIPAENTTVKTDIKNAERLALVGMSVSFSKIKGQALIF